MSLLLEMTVQTSTLDPIAATEAWMQTMTAEETARSNAYFEGGYWLILWNFLIGLGVAWLLLGRKRSARVRDWLAAKLPKFLVSPTYAFLYILIPTILTFPMTAYQGFFREGKYDLMNQTFGGWFSEQMIGLGIGLVIGTIALWGLFALIRKLGAAWRWWGTGVTIIFAAFMLLISPVFIAPLFNDYTPMEEGPLRTQILAMAEANNVPADNVYVFNISKQTDRVTANVSGFMGTTRISLSDTLLERISPEGVKGVMGHELGHYVLGHIYEMLVYLGLIILFGSMFTHSIYGRVQRKWGEKWGIGAIGDNAGMPLFFACFGFYMFLATPLLSTIIRNNETEADMFGFNAAAEPDGIAEAYMMLAEYRKMEPGKWEEIIFYDHPAGYTRVLNAMRWKAAHQTIDATPLLVTPLSAQEEKHD
ncbi:MAG: peptidase [Robiginitomaculum sp.]|nr:MAG: peptidase [Robiginitomaculum sp.]PHS77395.1 MAG: peptidase [Robiginitomaculum sp.]